MRTRTFIAALGGLWLCACNSQAPAPAQTDAPPFSNQATVAQLMHWIYDPQADIVWKVGGTIVTEKGEQQLVPKSDEEWNAVRNAAATVAEAGNLLLLEGRARDHGDWFKLARAMIDKANECVQAAEAKDVQGVFTAGGDLYIACSACHEKYIIAAQAQAASK